MRYILLLTGLFLSMISYSQCIQADIVIMADLSHSVAGKQWLISKAIDKFIKENDKNISFNGINISILGFSGEVVVEQKLTNDKNKLLLASNKVKSFSDGGNTNLYRATNTCENILINGRNGVHKIVILICDGDPNDTMNSRMRIYEMIDKLSLTSNVIFASIFIETQTSTNNHLNFMNSISSPGYFFRTDYEGLYRRINEINVCF